MLKAKIKLLESTAHSGTKLGVGAGGSSKEKTRGKANEKRSVQWSKYPDLFAYLTTCISAKAKKPKLGMASGLIADWNERNNDSDDESAMPVQARKSQQRSAKVVDDGLEMGTDVEPEEVQNKGTAVVRKTGKTAPSSAKIIMGQGAGRKPVRDQTRQNEVKFHVTMSFTSLF